MANGLLGDIRKRYETGTLLGGGGLVGQLLGPQARKQAQSRAIMQLGAGLLGQGPTRTPQRFGPALAQGLLSAQEQFKSGLGGQLGDVATLLSLQKTTQPKYEKIKLPDGSEGFMDVNPTSPTMGGILSATQMMGAPTTVAPSDAETGVSQELLEEVPLLETAATGELTGQIAKGIRAIGGRIGFEPGAEQAEAISYVENLNNDTKIALTKAFGGRLTAAVREELNKVLPDPDETNVNFRAKTKQFVNFADLKISELEDELARTPKLEDKRKLETDIQAFKNQVDRYKAILEKSRQYGADEGMFAPVAPRPLAQETTENLKLLFPESK